MKIILFYYLLDLFHLDHLFCAVLSFKHMAIIIYYYL